MGEKQLVLALRAQGASAAEARDLALVAGALALVPDPEIDAAFADALEARLLSEPIEQPVQAPSTVVTPIRRTIVLPEARPAAPKTKAPIATVTPLPRRKYTMRKTLAIAIAAAMLLALPVAASANSLPTSPFYRVKIAMEQLKLHFMGSDTSKGFYELDRAGTRLDEADQLASLGDNKHVTQVLAMMRASQRNGSNLIQGDSPTVSELARLRSLLLGYAEQLTTLLPQVNMTARSSVLATIRQGQSIANKLAPVLGLTIAAVKLPEVSAPSASFDQSGGSTAAPSRTSASDGSDGSDISKDPGGSATKRVHDGVDGGCSVPGSANGLGDLAAPLAKVVCK
ncbi:MAG: DUF5667 domain-containing protein [Actinomycetota bacterium]